MCCHVMPALVVRDLRIHIDADVSMRSHVMRTTSAMFCSITSATGHPPLGIPRTVFQSLVSCLVLPRLDYCNAVLAGIPLYLARRLQSVMNAAARLTYLRVIKLRPHHAAPTRITLAESSMADRLQTGRSGLQMSSWRGTVIPRGRTSPSSRVGVSWASAFRFVS